MGLRTTPTLTDQLLAVLTGIEDLLDVPRSMRQVVYKHEYEHFKFARRRTEAERRERTNTQKALWRLERAEYITQDRKRDAAQRYRLTPKGWLKFALKYAPILKKDKKTKGETRSLQEGSYVVIFDIPEKYRRFRDTLRQVLINIGCAPLQKSIFITRDHKVISFIARLIANCELEDRVKILLVKHIL